MIPNDLKYYIEHEILTRYDGFDAAHRRDHAEMVISQSMALAEHYDVNLSMVYTIAAYHDTGLSAGREYHHLESKKIILADSTLRRWFTDDQIATMADAAEDHRASSRREPRTLYGRIVAEADRVIIPESIIRRTIQFTLTHHPSLDREQGYIRLTEHLNEKYNYGGYLRLWIEHSENARRLEELRQIIAHPDHLRSIYDKIYDELVEQP